MRIIKQLFKRNYLVVFFVLLVAASCSSTKTITIEIPEPAQKELPSRIQSLVLVNRAVDDKYSDLNADTLQNIFYKKQFTLDTVIYDLTAVDTTLKAVGELLYESGRYDFVIPLNRFLDFKKNSFFSQEMPSNQVKELCNEYNADAVLSLDMFKTQITTQYKNEKYYDPFQHGYYTASEAKMKVVYDALFRIYDPIEEKVILREFLRDTIEWNNIAVSAKALFNNFTPVKTALSEAGIALALDFSEKISTVWREENRTFYTKGDKNLKLAATFADNDQWEQAMALWKDTAQKTKSKSIKSKAQFNVAIAYELQGDIDNAISWALESYSAMYRPLTYTYLELLERRKKELQKQNK